MLQKRFLFFLALIAMLALPVWSSADVLLDQAITSDNYESYLCFVADPDPGLLDEPPVAHKYDRYEADDFATGTDTWSISKIFIPGGFHGTGNPPHFPGLPNIYSNLNLAASLNWKIYSDNGGVPAGNPVTGLGDPAVWSSPPLPPSDPQVTITNGVVPGGDPYPSDVLLTLTTPVVLSPGTYWLVFYPIADATVIGRWGRQVSNSINGADAVVAGGGDGIPSAWTSVRDPSTWNLPTKDFAFKLEGTKGVLAPDISVAPTSKDFGSVPVNTASSNQAFVINNTGDATLTISGINITGAVGQADQFTKGSTTCGATLGAGLNCTQNVTFTPTSGGAKTANLVISSNDPDQATYNVGLSGFCTVPNISVAPTSKDFGSVPVNTASSNQAFVINNTGDATLTISGINITAGTTPADQFTKGSTTCGATLGAGLNCTQNVTFTPTSGGAKTANLVISSNDPDQATYNVGLSGFCTVPNISVAPTSKDFGSVPVNTASSNQAFVINNTGDATLTISGINITAGTTPADQFTKGSTTCGATLGAGLNCTQNVTFTPTSGGAKTANLVISSNDPDQATYNVGLSGFCTVPNISVAPTSKDFGSVPVNTASSNQAFVINNTGDATLTISGINITAGTTPADQFTKGSTTCGATLGAGLNCTQNVTFTPTSGGAKTANLVISSNDPDQATYNVGLSGFCTVPNISVAPTSKDFGSVPVNTASSNQAFVINNTGDATLTISGINITAGTTPADQFTKGSTTCGATLGAGLNCTQNVTFTPTSGGAKTANLVISSNDPDQATYNVGLSGFCTVPGISVSPTSLTFDPEIVGQTSADKTVTIQNTGDATLTISGINITGAVGQADQFTKGSTTCGATLGAGLNCTQNVTFTPTSVGAKAASLDITSNASDVNVPMTGTGIPAETLVVEGTIGTEIIIDGDNFGIKKGKVLIGDVVNKKAVVTKIAKEDWTEGRITCTVKKVPEGSPGTFAITIQTKSEGATSVTLSNAFTVKLPEPDALTPSNNSGFQRDDITLKGNFFGTKKGKAYLAYTDSRGRDKLKKCKIVSWDMNSITFQVPKLDPNTYPLSIKNKVGSVAVGDFTINN